MKIPESEFEYHRTMSERYGIPTCCIEAFLQGRDGDDFRKDYALEWGDLTREKKIFGKVLDYIPCKDCCENLAAGGER